MKINQKMLLKNWIYIAIVFILSTLGLAILVWYSGSELIIKSTDRFGRFYLEEIKLDIKNEVEQRLDEIDFELNEILVENKNVIKEKIHNLKVKMDQSEVSSIEDEEARKLAAVALYEELTRDEDDLLYFAISEEGVMLKSGTDKVMNGTNLYDLQDIEGKYYIREMLKTVGKESGQYISYYWPKVKEGLPLKKTSYCLHLPEYNMIIGTGFYDEDVQSTLLSMFVTRLKTYYEDEINYNFIHSYDSTILISGDEASIGQKMNSVVNSDKAVLHTELLEAALRENGGYVNYQNGDISQDNSDKIYYVKQLRNGKPILD